MTKYCKLDPMTLKIHCNQWKYNEASGAGQEFEKRHDYEKPKMVSKTILYVKGFPFKNNRFDNLTTKTPEHHF